MTLSASNPVHADFEALGFFVDLTAAPLSGSQPQKAHQQGVNAVSGGSWWMGEAGFVPAHF
jgi:hypothetical protein